jgi:hypothetical protein
MYHMFSMTVLKVRHVLYDLNDTVLKVGHVPYVLTLNNGFKSSKLDMYPMFSMTQTSKLDMYPMFSMTQ